MNSNIIPFPRQLLSEALGIHNKPQWGEDRRGHQGPDVSYVTELQLLFAQLRAALDTFHGSGNCFQIA